MYLYGPRILPMGDSITSDVTPPSEGAYRHYMGESFSTWFGANVVWVGENAAVGLNTWSGKKMCGASGQRVDQISSTYDPGGQVLRQQPELIIIHLGTNDCTQVNSGAWVGGSVALSITNLGTLLTTIFANADANALVCVCKIVPNTLAAVDTLITTWNSSMATMVAAHANTSRIFIADINTAFKNNASWATDYMNDATHPNSAGKAVMGSTIQSAIQSNITLMPRTTAARRVAIRPFTASLEYINDTTTDLGASTFLDTTQPWAVAWWCDTSNARLLPGTNGMLSFKTDQATPLYFFAIQTNPRYWEIGSSGFLSRVFPNVAVAGDVSVKSRTGWHQIVFVFDGVARGTLSSYKIYLDGADVGAAQGGAVGAVSNLNSIGRNGASNNGTFKMADLKVWNGGSTMTAAQVADLYYDHKLPSGPTLTHDYPHTDGAGSTLTDTVGGANGTIGTAAWDTADIPNKGRTALGVARTVAAARTVAS